MFFPRNRKVNPKVPVKSQGTQNRPNNIGGGGEDIAVEGLTLSDSTAYHKATVMEPKWHWRKKQTSTLCTLIE